jgi:hypothetical protein
MLLRRASHLAPDGGALRLFCDEDEVADDLSVWRVTRLWIKAQRRGKADSAGRATQGTGCPRGRRRQDVCAAAALEKGGGVREDVVFMDLERGESPTRALRKRRGHRMRAGRRPTHEELAWRWGAPDFVPTVHVVERPPSTSSMRHRQRRQCNTVNVVKRQTRLENAYLVLESSTSRTNCSTA